MRYFRLTVDKFESIFNPHNCQIIMLSLGNEPALAEGTTNKPKYYLDTQLGDPLVSSRVIKVHLKSGEMLERKVHD